MESSRPAQDSCPSADNLLDPCRLTKAASDRKFPSYFLVPKVSAPNRDHPNHWVLLRPLACLSLLAAIACGRALSTVLCKISLIYSVSASMIGSY